MGLDVGDVGHPDRIGSGCLAPLLQPVLGDDGRFATIAARTSLAAQLSSDPGQRRQSGNPVLRYAFAQAAQIVGQPAIAVDLAAVGLGLPDQLYLSHILLRTVA